MSRILSLVALFLLIAFPIASFAIPVPTVVHRLGNKSNPLGGAFRTQDWDLSLDGGTVKPSRTKGLSFNTQRPTSVVKGQKVWSIDDQRFAHSTDFVLTHDGGQGGRGAGHASLHYIGSDIDKNLLKTKIVNLPWMKRSLGGNARRLYRRSVKAERAYRMEQLENGYRRALEELD